MKISHTFWPYYWLGALKGRPESEKLIVFFGADFRNIPEVNSELFIEKTNRCLDYIRRNYADCQLIYRPHPDETDESHLFNLTSFSVQKDDQIAETFLWKNRERIKYIFSVCSTSSIAGFNMGLNAYSFYRYFRELFKGASRIFDDHYFTGFPDDFFIENLSVPLFANKRELKEDYELLESFK